MCADTPHFVRMVAWFKLVKFWCTLRFDDHRGLVPSRIRLLRSGLRGTLVRTKTSGVGKSREELEVVIVQAAFLFMSAWLQTGWAVWELVGTGRDYFMGLPTPDLMGMRQVEAKYAHAVAMDHALLQQLKNSSGQPLLHHAVACEFWTLHSDRASLPSFAACLSEVPPEWIEDLGRWSKSMSATYVRIHLSRIRTIQRWVASAARTGELVDEEELWSDFAVFLMKHGSGTRKPLSRSCSWRRCWPMHGPRSQRPAPRMLGPARVCQMLL